MTYDLFVARARDPLIAITIFVLIAFVTTGLRLRARVLRALYFSIDDYFMVAVLGFLCISVGIQYACVIEGGVGRHTADINPLDAVKTLKLILPFEALYGVTLCLIKISIVTFYLRIFGTARSFRISAFVAIGILIAWASSVVLETVLLCRPLAYNWNTAIKGTCGNRNVVYVSAGSFNVVTDFMVMGLPIPHILTLQLGLKAKMGLILMISLGLFITIVSIIRIRSLQAISFTDPTYTLPMGLLWTTLEPCLCIINGNLPMVRTYLATSFPTVFGSTKDNTKGASGGQQSHGITFGRGGSKVGGNTFEMLDSERNGVGDDVDSMESQERLTKGNLTMTTIEGVASTEHL